MVAGSILPFFSFQFALSASGSGELRGKRLTCSVLKSGSVAGTYGTCASNSVQCGIEAANGLRVAYYQMAPNPAECVSAGSCWATAPKHQQQNDGSLAERSKGERA
jgi:hypothetical protein